MSEPFGSDDRATTLDFRVLFDALPGKYLVLDPSLNIVAASDEYLRATLTRRHEIVGRFLFDVFPDNPSDPGSESGRNMRASIARVFDLGVADSMPLARHDVRRPHDSGFDEKYWSPVNSPVSDGLGGVAYVVHKVEDVTEFVNLRRAGGAEARDDVGDTSTTSASELVQAELIGRRVEVAALHTQLIEASARMRQSEQTLLEFLDFAPAVISARDKAGHLLIHNRHYEDRFRRPQDPGGMHDAEVALPDDLLDWSRALEREVIDTGVAMSSESAFPGAGGEMVTYAFTKFPLRTPSGAIYGVGTIATDITDDRKARDALQFSEERFRQMAENVDEVFLLWEAGTLEMLYVSPAVERITGLDASRFSDPVGRLTIVHPDDREIVTSEPALLKEFRIIKPDGEVRWIRSRTTLIETPDGQSDRGVTTMTDFTERKVAELAALAARTEAEAANHAKSEFLSRMSHELRTPLNAILGFGQLLEMDELDEGQRDGVEHIIRSGEHLLGLINDVLDISTVETGNIRLSLEPVSVREVVVKAVGMIRPIAGRNGVHIGDPTGPDVFVQADHLRLTQVVVNLLSNAVKYTSRGGAVRVESDVVASGRLRLSIIDTGIGITATDFERLFQPFERLSAGRSEVQGTGLGLALTKHLMTAMGGRIGLSSRIGEGSSFWIELPITDGPVAAVPESIGAAVEMRPVTGGRTAVLYVEDNPSNVRLLERVVERRPGVELMVAMQGHIAIELALSHQPDLILLDLHLPDMSGDDVLRALRTDPRTVDTPVIVISADATADGAARLIALGASAYLTKPFSIPRLLEMIDAVGAATGLTTEIVRTVSAPNRTADAMVAARSASAGILDIVHDLNNQLGVIVNYCALVSGAEVDDSVASDLVEIQAATERAIGLVKDVAELASPRADEHRAEQRAPSAP